MSEADVSDDAIIVDAEVIEGLDTTVIVAQGYTPPLDGSDDLVAEFDQRIARGVAELLLTKFFGYDWHVLAESRQGIVAFSIPDLMGPTLKYVIRLAEYSELTPELILRCGGELLERMGLPRTRADMARVHEARLNRHKFDFDSVAQ